MSYSGSGYDAARFTYKIALSERPWSSKYLIYCLCYFTKQTHTGTQVLPASCTQSISDVTFELIADAQLLNLPPASRPNVSYRAFTPQSKAVAHADDSPV